MRWTPHSRRRLRMKSATSSAMALRLLAFSPRVPGPGEAETLRWFTSRLVRPSDVYKLRWADDPRISPDGGTVAFVAWGIDRQANDYRASISLVPRAGSGAPRRLTRGETQDAAPRPSPARPQAPLGAT